MPIKTQIKTVTPHMCKTWLDRNKNNRPLNQPHVNTLVRAMARGDWTLNGEALKFDAEGNVLDGQHRMTACILSKVPFKTMIITGLPRESFDTIDTGRNRNPADILAINGEKNTTILSGAIRHVMRYQNNTMHNVQTITNRELENGLELNPDLRKSATWAATNRVRWLSSVLVATIHYLLHQLDEEKATEFMEGLILGTNLTPDSVILVVRNKFIDIQGSHLHKMTIIQRFEMIILAWNLWIKDKTQSRFSVAKFSTKSADFPRFKAP